MIGDFSWPPGIHFHNLVPFISFLAPRLPHCLRAAPRLGIYSNLMYGVST